MKSTYVKEFFKIGCMSAGGGPLILALIYWGLSAAGKIGALSVSEVVLGILTSMILAFISGGISVVYRIERLPLLWASLIHASVLYLDYLLIYLLNGWLERAAVPILIFTGIFAAVYFVIWGCVYHSIQHTVEKMNSQLRAQ